MGCRRAAVHKTRNWVAILSVCVSVVHFDLGWGWCCCWWTRAVRGRKQTNNGAHWHKTHTHTKATVRYIIVYTTWIYKSVLRHTEYFVSEDGGHCECVAKWHRTSRKYLRRFNVAVCFCTWILKILCLSSSNLWCHMMNYVRHACG